ncbi:ABC transporter substrate-binding protein [Nocardioides sp. KR10-350]|uniref:ABC transporter substrate-binding protein n=1 Tax=Nocardioides cheoyonin TaxID=3156615 RepID=UPI0032B60EB9
MRASTTVGGIAAAGLALSTLAGCGSSSDAASGMKLTIGYTAIGAAYSDLYVCEDQGVFKKNGLDVKLTLLNSSSQLVAGLASNSVQIGAGVASSTAAGILKGIDLRYVALPIPHYYLEMWGKPSITSVDDIKGKKIGLSSPGSLGDASLDALLEEKGWSEDDVQKTFLKSTPAEVTALEQGAVDAIVTQPPTGTQTREKGFTKVTDFTKFPAAANAYTVKASYLDSNSKAIAAFVKSETECLSILHNNKKAAIASILKHSGNDDPELAEYSYNFFNRLWAKEPSVAPELIDQAFAAAAAEGDGEKPSDTAKYVDNSFVDQLKQSGFINSLYSKNAAAKDANGNQS